jgi:broad specificity phosphatase PhoE
MLVTFLRHGQSEHNAGLTDFLDSGLTDLGRQQAQAVAKRFRMEGITPDGTIAFVSPLQRTLQTLAPTVESLCIRAELFTAVCEYFSIRNDGYLCFEGLTPSTIEKQFPWAEQGTRFGIDEVWWPQELEDVNRLYQRAEHVRDQLIELFVNTDLQLIIVSHADPIGRMIEAFLRIGPDRDEYPWTDNCALTRLLVSNPTAPAEIAVLNDVSHLDALSLRTPQK